MSSFHSLVVSELNAAPLEQGHTRDLPGALALLRSGFQGRLHLQLAMPQRSADWARMAALLSGEIGTDTCADLLTRACGGRQDSLALFSHGNLGNESAFEHAQVVVFSDVDRGIYRKLVLRNGRLCGVLALGELQGGSRWIEAIKDAQRTSLRMLWQFQQCGELWDGASLQQDQRGPFGVRGVVGGVSC